MDLREDVHQVFPNSTVSLNSLVMDEKATNKKRELVPLITSTPKRNRQDNLDDLFKYWFNNEFEASTTQVISKEDIIQIIQQTLGPDFPDETVIKFLATQEFVPKVKNGNKISHFCVKKKNVTVIIQQTSTPSPLKKEEINIISQKENGNYISKSPLSSEVQEKSDEKLLKVLKTFNGNAKKLLKDVKPASIHDSLRILLSLVEGMSGDLSYFLDLWYEDKALNKSIVQYFKEKFEDQKLEIQEKAIISFVRKVNEHFASVSQYISTMMPVQKYKELKNLLYFEKDTKIPMSYPIGNSAIFFPTIASYYRILKDRKFGFLVEDEQDYLNKKLNKQKVNLNFYAVTYQGKERIKHTKEELLEAKKEKKIVNNDFIKENIDKLDTEKLKLHEEELKEIEELFETDVIDGMIVTT